MKKILLTALMAISTIMAFSQAKKPTLMIMPADVWCITNGYYKVVDSNGDQVKVPDYDRALQENQDLHMAISTINQMMADRNFPLKDLGQTLRSIREENAEQIVTTSKQGATMQESPLDKLLRVANADIIIYLNWSVSTQGPKKTLSYQLDAIDAYTSMAIGGTTGKSAPSLSADVTTLLNEAVVANIDEFNSSLMNYFEQMATKGREVKLQIRVFENNAGLDLESEFGGIELSEVIENWMEANTVKGRYTKAVGSPTRLDFEQVRIPLYDANEHALDTEKWARGLRNMLRQAPYSLDVRLKPFGLGRVVVYLDKK